jgi:hypothetical protein
MRTLLVAAASLLLACSAGCEKTVREARNSTSRQQSLRQPSFAPRSVARTTQARASARPVATSRLLRPPSLPAQLAGRQTASVQGSQLRAPQQQRQAQAPSKPSLVNSVLSYPKRMLSKLGKLL